MTKKLLEILLEIPPTKNHRQLAKWINEQHLFDSLGRSIEAVVEKGYCNTDRKLAGTRLIHKGKGRTGLELLVWAAGTQRWDRQQALFRHNSAETYRRHEEARRWVAENLHKAAHRQ